MREWNGEHGAVRGRWRSGRLILQIQYWRHEHCNLGAVRYQSEEFNVSSFVLSDVLYLESATPTREAALPRGWELSAGLGLAELLRYCRYCMYGQVGKLASDDLRGQPSAQ